MDAEDHFARLDDLDRELEQVSGVHLVDVDTIDIDADEEAVEVTADVRGVRVQAWYDEDRGINVYSEDEGFEDPDDVHAHLNAGDNSRTICVGYSTRSSGCGRITATPALRTTENTVATVPSDGMMEQIEVAQPTFAADPQGGSSDAAGGGAGGRR